MQENNKMIIIRKILVSIVLLMSFKLQNAKAIDLEQTVLGSDVPDSLSESKESSETPYVTDQSESGLEKVQENSNSAPDYIFNDKVKEISLEKDPKNSLRDFGYTLPGSGENHENYIDVDKKAYADEFRKYSSRALNLTFIKNDFVYESENDVINRTIGDGYKHVKGGALYLRNDQYIYHSELLNAFWSLGGGIGYNSGRGIFINGERSETTFRLWEFPIDLGIGLEIPITHLFKISGAAGPSVLGLMQNRNDILAGEKGKNKMQIGYGQFADAQLKINLAGITSESAYTLFTESSITNLFMNLEIRYQNYQRFQDAITISGTSLGIGFTFEYL